MREKMTCPDCGVEMNHHAMKIDYAAEDAEGFDEAFGGVVEEAHSCPECGMTHMHKASEKSEAES